MTAKTSPSATMQEAASVCNGAALRKATRRLSQLYDEALAPSGLRLSQHSVLVHIYRAVTPTMTDLARDMVLDRSALSHNLKPLERDGYVSLLKDSSDKRITRVSLTNAGRRKLNETKALWAIAHRRFEAAFGAEKARDMRALLFEICSAEFGEKYENQSM